MKIKPMAILLTMLAGWMNRQQMDIIEYLTEENRMLREKLGTNQHEKGSSIKFLSLSSKCSPSPVWN